MRHSIRTRTLLGALALVSAVLACGASKEGEEGSFGGAGRGGRGGSSATALPDALRPGTGLTGGLADDDTCGQQNFNLERLPPEIIVVKDKSGSMMRDMPTRWSQTTGALAEVLPRTQAGVLWGLQLYPTCQWTGNGRECAPNPCSVQGGAIAPALNQADLISMTIAAAAPRLDTGATPTREAVRIATRALQARTTPNPKFILLATDGEPNCLNQNGDLTSAGDNDRAGAVAAIRDARSAGFDVFVVGVASSNGSNLHQTLNEMADAGGRPRAGQTRYYVGNSRAELVSSLSAIASATQGCTFNLQTPPPEDAHAVVEIDGMRLTDAQWTWGAGRRSVSVTGVWCERLMAGQAQSAVIKWRCGNLPID